MIFSRGCDNTKPVSFHLGKPILVMILAAIVAGAVVAFRSPMPKARHVLWIFAESHQRSYTGDDRATGETPAHKYTRTSGNSLDIVLMAARAEDIRLASIFNTHGKGQAVPDAVEIEISKVGKFFRPPLSQIGFLPLNDFLKNSGWYDQIVQTRFAPYSKNGVIFGVPHDIHPTTVTYRKDLFDEAGVDLAAAKTWPEFRDACQKFRQYWRSRGRPRWPIGLRRASADDVICILQQRNINVCDDHNRIFINDPVVAQTMRFYCEMVAGRQPIGTDFNPAPGMNYRDIANGDVCAMITPDWMVAYLKIYSPEARGKLAMVQMPVFQATDHPTVSWGGTMIGIPRDCADPQASWKLIESLYFDHDSVAYRRQIDQILPPIRKYWSDEIYQRGDPFFANDQNVYQLYIKLAEKLPTRYVTPFTVIGQQLVADVLNRSVRRIDDGDTANLDRDIQQWLDDSAKDLKRRIDFGTFED